MAAYTNTSLLLLLGGCCLFVSVKQLHSGKLRGGYRGIHSRVYRSNDYPVMFWSETIIMGLAGLWNIGFSMNPASRYWLVGFATLMALAMIVWLLAKRLDENRHGHK